MKRRTQNMSDCCGSDHESSLATSCSSKNDFKIKINLKAQADSSNEGSLNNISSETQSNSPLNSQQYGAFSQNVKLPMIKLPVAPLPSAQELINSLS